MNQDYRRTLGRMRRDILAIATGLLAMFEDPDVYRFGPGVVEGLVRVYVDLRHMLQDDDGEEVVDK